VELSMASKARATLLNNEKNEKRKLLETIEHYKKNLAEREEVVAEKEKIIMELRSKTRTLENFRFVLDYRLQQLSAERGPITSHIEGLERHISTMYEELVEEFEKKKSDKVEKEKNEQRNALVLADLNHERLTNRKRERFVAAFKRELGNIVSAMVSGKELEESVRLLYRKFVKGDVIADSTIKASEQAVDAAKNLLAEDDDLLSTASTGTPGNKQQPSRAVNVAKGAAFQLEVEETLVETAKEAERQKLSKEKEASQLKHRLDSTAREALVMGRKRRGENSNLLFEVNDMRKALRKSDHKIFERDEKIKQLEHRIREMELTAKLAKSGKTLSKLKTLGPTAQQANITQPGGVMPVSVGSTDPATRAVVVPSAPVIAPTSETITDTLPNTETNDTTHAQPQPQPQPQAQNVGVGQSKIMKMSHSTPALTIARGVGIDVRMTRGGKPASQLSKTKSEEVLMAESAENINELAALLGEEIEKKSTKRDKKGSGLNALKGDAVKTQRVIERLQREVDDLSSNLDESYRVRENQRVEIGALRKQMLRMSGKGFAGVKPAFESLDKPSTGQALEDTMNLSEEFAGSMTDSPDGRWGQVQAGDLNEGSIAVSGTIVRASGGLTEADRTGIPSQNDLKDLTLGPAQNIQPPATMQQHDAVPEVDKTPVVFPVIAPSGGSVGDKSVDESVEEGSSR
jgi:hypothetical protein